MPLLCFIKGRQVFARRLPSVFVYNMCLVERRRGSEVEGNGIFLRM
jgi:hypothetical protein